MSIILPTFIAEFSRYRTYADSAVQHLSLSHLQVSLDTQTNSIAVIMKHLGGNLRSRWSDIWTTDGEKPWRNRDAEFCDDFTTKDEVLAAWHAGWHTLEATLATLQDADLQRQLFIRHEPHTLALALTRSLSHTAYHVGQIVQLARHISSRDNLPWQTITIPKGQSAALNDAMRTQAQMRNDTRI